MPEFGIFASDAVSASACLNNYHAWTEYGEVFNQVLGRNLPTKRGTTRFVLTMKVSPGRLLQGTERADLIEATGMLVIPLGKQETCLQTVLRHWEILQNASGPYTHE